jgi:hypothetical protein
MDTVYSCVLISYAIQAYRYITIILCMYAYRVSAWIILLVFR